MEEYKRCPCCGSIIESNNLNLAKASIIKKIISDKRINNLKEAFPSVKWNPMTLVIIPLTSYLGNHRFSIEGTIALPHIKKRITVRWHSQYSGGSHASFFYWWEKKLYKIPGTALKRAPELLEQIADRINRLTQ